MKEAPNQAKGVGAFSFWDGFDAGIQPTGSLPDSPPEFSHWGTTVETTLDNDVRLSHTLRRLVLFHRIPDQRQPGAPRSHAASRWRDPHK
jgi:hypothetical protein